MDEYKIIQDSKDAYLYSIIKNDEEFGVINTKFCTVRDTVGEPLELTAVLKFETLIKAVFNKDDTHEMNLNGDLVKLKDLFSGIKSGLTPEILGNYHQMIKYTKAYGETQEVANTMALKPKRAYQWARRTGKKFEAGEPAITQDPQSAYLYAKNMTGKRYGKEVEALISTDAQVWGWYCDFFKMIFVNGEEVIKGSAMYAYLYARDYTGARCSEATESVIREDVQVWALYCELFEIVEVVAEEIIDVK